MEVLKISSDNARVQRFFEGRSNPSAWGTRPKTVHVLYSNGEYGRQNPLTALYKRTILRYIAHSSGIWRGDMGFPDSRSFR